jgi:hypothetical protein
MSHAARRGDFLSRAGGAFVLSALTLAAGGFAGCLDEPPVEDRWNSIELLSSNINDETVIPVGTTTQVAVSARITFREILTGFVVAELRVSQSMEYSDVLLDFDERKIATSLDVDRILQQSVPAGRATQIVTGYPQLMRTLNLEFEATIPAAVDSTYDPPGGDTRSMFLVLYMGSGDEIELEDGSDSLVIDPFHTQEDRILHKGFAVPLTAPPPSS